MSNEEICYYCGVVTGLIVLMGVQLLCGAIPSHQLQKDRQEAVERGHAQWVATTNGEVQFKWNNVNTNINSRFINNTNWLEHSY